MGNDLVGQIFDAFQKFRPGKTIIKIWNKGDLSIILAVKDPKEWEMEMDPYYVYSKGKIDGISYIDNADLVSRVAKPNFLIYHDKVVEG